MVLRGPSPDLEQWQLALARWPLQATVSLGLAPGLRDLPVSLDKPGEADRVNAYVCEGVTCLPAVGTLDELRELLLARRP